MRLALYARVSSDRQEREGTIESQKAALLAYAAELGGEIVPDGESPVFTDDGYTGATLDRPALSRLRELIARGGVDVMVHETSRLSREQTDQFIVFREIRRAGSNVYLAKSRQRIEDTSEGKALLTLYSLLDDLEREKIIERARRGGKHRAKAEGRRNGGIPSFGFDLVEGRYVLNPEEVEHCRQMRTWLVSGITPGRIASRLMAEGVPTKYDSLRNQRGEPIVRKGSTRKRATWYPDQVRRILTDELYGGDLLYHAWDGETIRTPVPAIFTKAEIAEHRRIIQRNRSVKKRDDGEVNVLRGLIVCGDCGRRYIANRASKLAHYQRLYRCGVWKRPKHLRNCTNKTWTATRIESIVWGKVAALIEEPARIAEALQASESDRPQLRIAQLEKRLGELDAEDGRVREGLRVGVFTVEQAQSEIRRSESARSVIAGELAEIADRMHKQERAISLQAVLSGMRDRVAKATPEQKAAILREIVERVTVNGEQVEIQLLIPGPNKGIGQAVPSFGIVLRGAGER